MATKGAPGPVNPDDEFKKLVHVFQGGELNPEEEAEIGEHIEGRARTLVVLQVMADQERAERDQLDSDQALDTDYYRHIFVREAEAAHIFSVVDQEVRILHAQGVISEEGKNERIAVAGWIQDLTSLLPFSESLVSLVAEELSKEDKERLRAAATEETFIQNDPEDPLDEPKLHMQGRVDITEELSQEWKNRINRVIDALRDGDSIFSLDEVEKNKLRVEIAMQQSIDEEAERRRRIAEKVLKEALGSHESNPHYRLAITELSLIAVEQHRGRRVREDGVEDYHVTVARTSLKAMGLKYDSPVIEAVMNDAVAALQAT